MIVDKFRLKSYKVKNILWYHYTVMIEGDVE